MFLTKSKVLEDKGFYFDIVIPLAPRTKCLAHYRSSKIIFEWMSTHFSQKASQKEVELICLKMIVCFMLRAVEVSSAAGRGGHPPSPWDEQSPLSYTQEPEMVSPPGSWRTERSSIQAERQLTMEIVLASSSRNILYGGLALVQLSGPIWYSGGMWLWIRVILWTRKRRQGKWGWGPCLSPWTSSVWGETVVASWMCLSWLGWMYVAFPGQMLVSVRGCSSEGMV